jgi:hypothetical protein
MFHQAATKRPVLRGGVYRSGSNPGDSVAFPQTVDADDAPILSLSNESANGELDNTTSLVKVVINLKSAFG